MANYVVLGTRVYFRFAQTDHQRHITANATEELKLDGFRAQAIKSRGRVRFRSRNDKDFNARYPAIVQALAAMPDETVI
jgi:ATP-dependent DNA ligase